ncbi:MAG TPA: DUF1062 domain-containing protein [Terriglobales bacterium]|nr:DUF1062 domain-containing protein [Terriglobales bacterium]
MATENRQFVRRCQRCRCPRRFRCTNKFRVNANGKRIDVWLLFDCCACGATAKLPVLERVAISAIGAARLGAFETNDPEEAAAAACDVALLRRGGFRMGADARSPPE